MSDHHEPSGTGAVRCIERRQRQGPVRRTERALAGAADVDRAA